MRTPYLDALRRVLVIGAFLAFALLGESLSLKYLIALLIMIAGTVLVVISTLKMNNVCRGKI